MNFVFMSASSVLDFSRIMILTGDTEMRIGVSIYRVLKLASAAFTFAILLGVSLQPNVTHAQEGSDVTSWVQGNLPLRLNAPDLSFLNHKPAGSKGHVRAANEALVFEDGSPAIFWGANLQAYALFSTKPEFIRAHAKRIAALGYNLVRIHHHDSHWVNPNIFGHRAAVTTQLDNSALARLDTWIAALKEEGIYIWLDLHVGRRITAGDEVKDFVEIAKGESRASIKGFNYVSNSIQQSMLRFQGSYLRHVNSITGLAYAEDPAIIGVLITNENDLTHHFGNSLLPNKNVPTHSAIYMAQAKEFSDTHKLDPDKTWRSWEHGPSKIFLSDLENRFFQKMIADVKASGFSGLIANTNSWGGMSIAGLPSLTEGSIIDVHSYGSGDDIKHDPRHTSGFLAWVAAAHVAGKPLSISEWNVSPFPIEDRFTAPLRMAVSAAHQEWDAPMVYGYAQQPLNAALSPSNWSIASDPGMISMMPAAALLYRQGHISPASKTYALRLAAEEFFGTPISPKSSAAIRTLIEQSKLVIEIPDVPELPWLRAATADAEAIPVSDPNRAYLSETVTTIVADTGEFQRDFRKGIFSVDTTRSQIIAGWVGSEEITLSNISLSLKTPVAAVAVQSLDGKPIETSRKIMISVASRSIPLGEDQVAYRQEPLNGQLLIRAQHDLQLRQPRNPETKPAASHAFNGRDHVIDLTGLAGANWLLLE